MANKPEPGSELTSFEFLTFYLRLGIILLHVLYTLILSPFRDRDATPRSLRRHVTSTLIRDIVAWMSIRQVRLTSGPTSKSYNDFCVKKGLTPTITQRESFRGYWLGKPRAAYVILYLEGGGYASQIKQQQYPFLYNAMTKSDVDISTFILDYSLLPDAIYPTQLVEAISALNYLTLELKFRPSQIILVGDSSGGHLSLSLLSHISHPIPNLPVVEMRSDQKFAGVHLLSPWVSFSLSTVSMQENKYKDVLDHGCLSRWSKMLIRGTGSTYYNEALTAPEDWWVDTKTERTLVCCGDEEIFRDAIVEWYQKYKVGNLNTKLVIAKGETHCEPIFGRDLSGSKISQQQIEFETWLKDCVRS